MPRVTIAGGPAKLTKLAEGKLDLHSKRGAVDLAALAFRIGEAGGPASLTQAIAGANTALHAFELAATSGFDLAGADRRRRLARPPRAFSRGAPTELEIVVVGRDGRILASSGFRGV